MSTVKYKYNSLEDFLLSNILTVDGQLDDGWGAMFPVRGREIEATILFADISSFSARTLELTSTETLVFVNNFFAWITAEALRHGHGIVDKYIGDEAMIVFSKEFGSEDPFLEAVRTARWIGERDAHSFMPHIGIARGLVTVGYVGTPIKFNCSVFGPPVVRAARCASVKPKLQGTISSSIVFPASEWGDRDFRSVFPPRKYEVEGEVHEMPHTWQMMEPRTANLKNLGEVKLREIVKRSIHLPSMSASERARIGLRSLSQQGRYWPQTS